GKHYATARRPGKPSTSQAVAGSALAQAPRPAPPQSVRRRPQRLANLAGEVVAAVGLVEEQHPRVEATVVDDGVLGVARGVEHPKAGVQHPGMLRQIAALMPPGITISVNSRSMSSRWRRITMASGPLPASST